MGFHNFGGLPFSFQTQENKGRLSDKFWENSNKSNDDWDIKVEKEQTKWFETLEEREKEDTACYFDQGKFSN